MLNQKKLLGFTEYDKNHPELFDFMLMLGPALGGIPTATPYWREHALLKIDLLNEQSILLRRQAGDTPYGPQDFLERFNHIVEYYRIQVKHLENAAREQFPERYAE